MDTQSYRCLPLSVPPYAVAWQFTEGVFCFVFSPTDIANNNTTGMIFTVLFKFRICVSMLSMISLSILIGFSCFCYFPRLGIVADHSITQI